MRTDQRDLEQRQSHGSSGWLHRHRPPTSTTCRCETVVAGLRGGAGVPIDACFG